MSEARTCLGEDIAFGIAHVHILQDVDSFSVGGVNRSRAFDDVDACDDSIGKQPLRNDHGNADASLPSHESKSCSVAFPCANSLSRESHRDTIHIDQALGQSELHPVASIDTHFSMFHWNPQGIHSEAKQSFLIHFYSICSNRP